MYSFLVLTFSVVAVHRCMGEDDYTHLSSTEAVKLLIVENEDKQPKEIVVEPEERPHYSEESDHKEHDYYLEEDEDMILRDNNEYVLKNVGKNVDVGIQVQDNIRDEFYASAVNNFGRPQKYNIDVVIRKEPPRVEKDKENVLVRLVKTAMKYTG